MQSIDAFSVYLKAFATGPKGNRDLSYDECYQACKIVLNQDIPPELIGAFLMTWRVKAESSIEMKAALDALKSDALSLPSKSHSLEIAMPMEGKKKNIPLSFLVAGYIPDIPLVLSTSPSMKKEGAVSLLDLQEHSPDNLHIISRHSYLPKLEALHQLRKNLKLRTVFNTLEKLHHPLKSDYAVIGAHHGPYFKKYADLFSHQYKRMAIVQGDEGCGEIIKKSKIHIIEEGKKVEEFVIDPQDFGIHFEKSENNLLPNEVIALLNNPTDSLKELARLNAAIYRYTINPKSSIENYFRKF